MNPFAYAIFISLCTVTLFSCGPRSARDETVQIQWAETLTGNFTFSRQWSYPEGIYRNDSGQPVCDGLCPERSEAMLDAEGHVIPDSARQYYALIDTTHRHYSLESETSAYEWAGSDFATAKRTPDGNVECATELNAGTHCSLILTFFNNRCKARIELTPIAAPGLKTYSCEKGFIQIDRSCWMKDTLKAVFDFTFNDPDNAEQPLFWRGKIYTSIIKPKER